MSKSCYQIAAGKKTTKDGSVMVARSCDARGNYATQIVSIPRKKHNSGEVIKIKKPIMPKTVEIPQVDETYSYVSVITRHEEETDLNHSMGGINEFQVCAGSSSGGPINDKASKVIPIMKSSLGDYRTTLVLERCKTARDGIHLLGKLTEKYGAREDYYIIADPKEVWYYEEYFGHLWAAVRIPDDAGIVVANHSRIKEVKLDDPENYMGSKNIISFAIENNLYDPNSGEPFNAMKVYGSHELKVRRGVNINYNGLREWRGLSLLAPSSNLDPEGSVYKYPLYVKPESKLEPKDLLNFLMDRYEGTKYDYFANEEKEFKMGDKQKHKLAFQIEGETQDLLQLNNKFKYQLAPGWNPIRILGTPRSVTTWCAQLRDWMPNQIGGLLWAGISEGATSAHIPFYNGITKTPEEYNTGTQNLYPWSKPFTVGSVYDEKSAFWRFRELSNLVNLFYDLTKDEVIPVWRKWEEQLYALQPSIEKVALELFQQDPELGTKYLTTYSNTRAEEALDMAKEMIKRVHTIIAYYMGPI